MEKDRVGAMWAEPTTVLERVEIKVTDSKLTRYALDGWFATTILELWVAKNQ